MAHFAEIDSTGTVVKIHVISNDVITDENGDEQEQLGIDFITEMNGGIGWFMQTSYNSSFRKQYAGIGYTYDKFNDVFIGPQPYIGWILDENFNWQPPTAMPDDGKEYFWNEETTSWVEIIFGE